MTTQPATDTVSQRICSRWTGEMMFEAQVDASLGWRLRIGAAVKAAFSAKIVLRGAFLRGAVLRGAFLRGADLSGADLSGADLRGAVLSGADLRDADLRPIKADLFLTLLTYRGEAAGVLRELRAGRING
jgi:hypothetical protein